MAYLDTLSLTVSPLAPLLSVLLAVFAAFLLGLVLAPTGDRSARWAAVVDGPVLEPWATVDAGIELAYRSYHATVRAAVSGRRSLAVRARLAWLAGDYTLATAYSGAACRRRRTAHPRMPRRYARAIVVLSDGTTIVDLAAA